MTIYVFSRLNKSNFSYSGRENLGYYSTLEKAYNKLKIHVNNVPTLSYVNNMIKRNGYYDIINEYYTAEFRIQIEKLE